MPGKSSKKATPRKKLDKSDQIFALLSGLDKKFTRQFNGLDKKVERMAEEAKAYREESAQQHESTRAYMRRFETETLHRFDQMDLKIAGFKDEILSVVDVTRKEYDETRQERIMIGHAQDRQRGEFETLKRSDEKQNQLLESLDTRVTELEMNKAA